MSVKQPQHVQLHVLQNNQIYVTTPPTNSYPQTQNMSPYTYSPTSPTEPEEMVVIVPNTNPQLDTVKTRSSSQHTVPTPEAEETPEPNKSSKWIAIGWFIWHTFDFLTDILTALPWTFGVSATLDLVRQNCDAIDIRNIGGAIIGPLLLIFSIIGYGCYLRDAYKVYILKIPMDEVAWRWLKIFKLFCEDAMSITITCLGSVFVIQLSTIAALSLSVSVISLIVMIFKHIVYTPYKKGEGCRSKCAVFACCICWMGCIVGLFFLGLLLYYYGISDEKGVLYIKEENSVRCSDVSELYEVDGGQEESSVYPYMLCTHESDQERFYCATNPDSKWDQAIIPGYVYFEKCEVFIVQKGDYRHVGEAITVCYDSTEPNLSY